MGLFSDDSPVEKKLKELTGGFRLSDSYVKLLEKNNLDKEAGNRIKNQLKEEISQGKLTVMTLEMRMIQLIQEYSADTPIPQTKECPKCHQTQDEDNTTCTKCGYDFTRKPSKKKIKMCPGCGIIVFDDETVCSNCGYDFISKKKVVIEGDALEFKNTTLFLRNFAFNLKTCPDCNTQLLKTDPFCFNCGSSVITADTTKNEHLTVKNGKLAAKTEDDELSSLEDLYSKRVTSRYSPTFRVIYVHYLKHLRDHPSEPFSSKLAKTYATTVDKLKDQAIEDNFIALTSPLREAEGFKVAELREILKENHLKVSGKKDELIERLGENLSDDELRKYFSSSTYEITEDGLEFLDENSCITYIYESEDIKKAFDPSEIAKLFEERKYTEDEIHEKLTDYLRMSLDEKLSNDEWSDFRTCSNALAQIQQDSGNLMDALDTRLKVFLFDINNYSVELKQPEPKKTRIKKGDVLKLNQLLHELSLPIDELKEIFESVYDEVLFETAISSKDSLIYLLKVFGGEDLEDISAEIRQSYSSPY